MKTYLETMLDTVESPLRHQRNRQLSVNALDVMAATGSVTEAQSIVEAQAASDRLLGLAFDHIRDAIRCTRFDG